MIRRQREKLTDLHVLEETGLNIRTRLDGLLAKAKGNPKYFQTKKGFNALESALTDAKWHTEESIKTARTSPVTGLRNRAALDSFLKTWSKHHATKNLDKGKAEPKEGITLIHFDLGALKRVNDNPFLGHDYGDLMLKRTGRLLQLVSRVHGVPEKQVFHHGGDEFAIAVTGEDSRKRGEAIAKTLIQVKNRMDSKPASRDPETATIHRENTFKAGLATAGTSTKGGLFELFKKSAKACEVVAATTNHGYLHNDAFESLSQSDRRFMKLMIKSIDSRLEDEHLPVNDRTELMKLLRKNELRLSRNNLRKALQMLHQEKRFDEILEEISTVKGHEIPDPKKAK